MYPIYTDFVTSMYPVRNLNSRQPCYPLTLNDLQQILLRLWSEISIKTCKNLVQPMPSCLQNRICMKGKTSSKY